MRTFVILLGILLRFWFSKGRCSVWLSTQWITWTPSVHSAADWRHFVPYQTDPPTEPESQKPTRKFTAPERERVTAPINKSHICIWSVRSSVWKSVSWKFGDNLGSQLFRGRVSDNDSWQSGFTSLVLFSKQKQLASGILFCLAFEKGLAIELFLNFTEY